MIWICITIVALVVGVVGVVGVVVLAARGGLSERVPAAPAAGDSVRTLSVDLSDRD